MTIWKFDLPFNVVGGINMPAGARILSVGLDAEGKPSLWALVVPDAPVERRNIKVYGTGWPLKVVPGQFIGTVAFPAAGLVWHVFEQLS